MRWSYKTVHYGLKKEGFLGSAFLDEAEVERSLNEYGQAGWELVSMMETQEGLIAIFKQPLEPPSEKLIVGEAIVDEAEFSKDNQDRITESDMEEEEQQNGSDDGNGLHTIRIE